MATSTVTTRFCFRLFLDSGDFSTNLYFLLANWEGVTLHPTGDQLILRTLWLRAQKVEWMNGAGQVVCGALKQLNNPKSPWDFMGCQVVLREQHR